MTGVSGQAMSSYLALCDEEIINAARLAAYVDHGLSPAGFRILCKGCPGLEDILPCDSTVSPTPAAGYSLPELDQAPWYDVNQPESKNFAGLLVTSATLSAPYSRNVQQNIGDGDTLGRLRRKGRTIVIHGWLIGKTCCATSYGLQWLTAVLGDPPCQGRACGGCDLDFLACCPNMSSEDACLVDVNGQPYVRQAGQTEFQRASDFFRRMKGAGVVDGPNVISCKGNSCGCGCGSLLEVEFTLQTSSPYVYSIATLECDLPLPACNPGDPCDITWVKCDTAAEECPSTTRCDEDTLCPTPALPPQAASTIPTSACACEQANSGAVVCTVNNDKVWSTTTLNIDIYAGSKELRNAVVEVYQNPTNSVCDASKLEPCDACATLFISYIPAYGTLTFSGEDRSVTITCNKETRQAASNVTDRDGRPFDWPDINCTNACVVVRYSCNTATDAKATITKVDRFL